jgi:hypothetical protein
LRRKIGFARGENSGANIWKQRNWTNSDHFEAIYKNRFRLSYHRTIASIDILEKFRYSENCTIQITMNYGELQRGLSSAALADAMKVYSNVGVHEKPT